MIDKLNDDCQLRIIDCLDFPDQLSLLIATKNFSERLNANVCWTWRKKEKFPLSCLLHELDDDPEMLDKILSTIGETLQSLKIKRLTLQQLKWLKNYKFPNVCELTCKDTRCSGFIELDMDLLAEIFPALKSLTLCNISIEDCIKIDSFKQLRKLSLFEMWDMYEIGGSETVEELSLGDNVVTYVYKDLGDFPKLQTLSMSIYNDDQSELVKVFTERGNEITELSFNVSFRETYTTTLQSCLKNLIRLTLINEDCSMQDLQTAVSAMPLLEQLDLVNFESLSTEIQLWKIVIACPSLKILYISGLHQDDFFERGRHHMKEALQNRSLPLTLHCHNVDNIGRDLVSTIETNPYLSIYKKYTCFLCRSNCSSNIRI